jgi:EF-hand domain-containing protein 1
VPQGDSQQVPMDSFADKQIPKAKFRDPSLKEYMEKSLGGGRVKCQKQFLDNDRRVLRFYARFDDLPFIIHYFLADDTVEIREVHHPNDGRDNFALLMKRQKLPKAFVVAQPGLQHMGDSYWTCDEFEPSGFIESFGRQFYIVGVDQFTQDYYRERLGKVFALGQIEYPKPRDPTERQIPPHNGFGDEIDSLGYVYRLIPEKPKKDFFKAVDNEGKILRFTAKFNTRVPEDLERRFIISFFLSDDSISIYEPAQKNSGIVEGKFLERRKYKNVNGEWVTPTDLAIGGDVKINGYSFHVLSTDEFTGRYLQGHLY